jgi:hypothetical protein
LFMEFRLTRIFFFSFNKLMFLFIKTKYFCYSFFDLGIEMFFLYFDRLLVEYKKLFLFLLIIARFILSSILSITDIFGIRNSYIAARLTVKINRFLITGI